VCRCAATAEGTSAAAQVRRQWTAGGGRPPWPGPTTSNLA
jgi:hypothetical protein